VRGPLFISVGKPEQLQRFLEVNQEVNPKNALIDSSSTFEAYRSAGFTNLLGDKKLEKPPDFKPPKTMTGGKWFSYLKNVATIAPQAEKFGQWPDGVRVLGGTYVIDGDEVLFSHQDTVPGATPDLKEVFSAAGIDGEPL
jgi:hypothetical protein